MSTFFLQATLRSNNKNRLLPGFHQTDNHLTINKFLISNTFITENSPLIILGSESAVANEFLTAIKMRRSWQVNSLRSITEAARESVEYPRLVVVLCKYFLCCTSTAATAVVDLDLTTTSVSRGVLRRGLTPRRSMGSPPPPTCNTPLYGDQGNGNQEHHHHNGLTVKCPEKNEMKNHFIFQAELGFVPTGHRRHDKTTRGMSRRLSFVLFLVCREGTTRNFYPANHNL